MPTGWQISFALCAAALAQPLPGTRALERQGDIAAQMVAGIDGWLMKRLAEAPRAKGDREELRRILGVVDQRVAFEEPWVDGMVIRWPVLDGVEGEGLLLRPRGKPRAYVVALPDADWTPEMIAGLSPGLKPEQQYARRLAESGCLVIVPVLIDRSSRFSGKEGVRFTNQPHREFVYRMAYEMGRHIIGYEVQKVMAAVDWLSREAPAGKIGVYGYGEGGLLALYAAALDERIAATLVSGYFGPREGVWNEPIYRNLWSQLLRFRDAEVASLIAPRRLIVEASAHPEVAGPPVETKERRGAASGMITTPGEEAVRAEVERARSHGTAVMLVKDKATEALLSALGLGGRSGGWNGGKAWVDVQARQRRQMWQMVEHVQRLVRESEFGRRAFPNALAQAGLEKMEAKADGYRAQFWDEVIGRMPEASRPPEALTRRTYDQPSFTGYEVELPVWDGIFAYGILLVPRDIRPGEKRPVVVVQHGLEDRPEYLVVPPNEGRERVYKRLAVKLVERGYVVFAPQNPYIGEEKFRVLLRKSHPLKLTLFSFITGQHARILEWLSKLDFVDKSRMGFYGLSYGGKTAMRVPALLKQYALSICSADFNEWVWKVTRVDEPFSYMYTREYDMLEFNLGHTFNYAEMAALIAPRPFMVERGHRDGVGIDEWVAYEYAKVRRLYGFLGIPERTAIEFFNGPHEINGVGTFEFLKRHLGR